MALGRRWRGAYSLIGILAIVAVCTGVQAQAGGDTWQQATTVEEGRVDGEITKVDPEDWYRLEVPEEHGVRWQYWSDMDRSIVSVREDDGTVLQRYRMWGIWPGWSRWSPVELAPEGSAVRLGVVRDGHTGSYEMTLETFPLPDVAIDRLVVDERPHAVGDVAQGPADTARWVEVDTSNTGIGGTKAWLTIWTETTTDGSTRQLAERQIDLDPGETITVEVPWDRTGQVGDVRVHARVDPWTFEPVISDNHAVTESHAFVDGQGLGVDAMNNAVHEDGTGARTFHHHRGTGACVKAQERTLDEPVGYQACRSRSLTVIPT